MKNKFTNQKALSLLIILALIINVSVSGISNSSLLSFILKSSSSASLLLIIFLHLHISKITSAAVFGSKAFKNILLITVFILIYFSITLLYSSNPAYGAQKIINIIISVVPNIIVLFYIFYTGDRGQYLEYLIIIIGIGLTIITIAVLIFNPFDHSTSYQFAPGRWSHVFVGRMTSFLTLIAFFFLISVKRFKLQSIYALIIIIGLYATYLTGLRSALIGLILCSLVSVLWNLLKKNLGLSHLYSFLLIILVAAALVWITPQAYITSERLEKLVKVENLDFGDDAAIITRVESYKLSWQMFTEKTVAGWGFGGFNGYDNLEWTRLQKYPHNIILEILSELGLIGLGLFLWLCYSILRRIYSAQFSIFNEQSEVKREKLKFKKDYNSSANSDAQKVTANYTLLTTNFSLLGSHFLLLTFCFSLFLAMLSKDISTQGLLWLFIVTFCSKGIENRV